MKEKKRPKKHQAVSGMAVDDGWDPDRPHGVYPTQRAVAGSYDGRKGRRKPSIESVPGYEPEADDDKERQGLRRIFREKRLFE